mmetsp:Transcript_33453/g.53871  ORF Transcript_33453/g.53871 Transcript_33453/m.53871 type:complete len:212 (-) Transcript_33453:630-1265(-)
MQGRSSHCVLTVAQDPQTQCMRLTNSLCCERCALLARPRHPHTQRISSSCPQHRNTWRRSKGRTNTFTQPQTSTKLKSGLWQRCVRPRRQSCTRISATTSRCSAGTCHHPPPVPLPYAYPPVPCPLRYYHHSRRYHHRHQTGLLRLLPFFLRHIQMHTPRTSTQHAWPARPRSCSHSGTLPLLRLLKNPSPRPRRRRNQSLGNRSRRHRQQ